ncbi:peptide deformylase [Candidatus Sumerlaeota bacterium]|nr:peptide deformylase [Candidatus Sumerlaeota bacterium]
MSYEILIYGNKILYNISKPLDGITPSIRKLIDEMGGIMYQYNGVGLAAPQVGELLRVIALDVDQVRTKENTTPKRRLQIMINPEILWESPEDAPYTEGCLSIPGVEGKVYRPYGVRVRYRDLDFQEHEIDAGDLLARVIQHEIDHLNGVLFVDRLGFTQRALLAGKLSQLRKKTGLGKDRRKKNKAGAL